jgi:hypothetical protein
MTRTGVVRCNCNPGFGPVAVPALRPLGVSHATASVPSFGVLVPLGRHAGEA